MVVVVLVDLPGAQVLVVDRQLIEAPGAEQRALVAGHQVQRRVGEVALARGRAFLLVADRDAVDVGGDLAAGRGCRVDHDRVVVPDPCARAGEEDAVARTGPADADAEGAAELARVRVDQEAAVVFVEVRGELHRERVVVGVGVPFQPELDRQLVRPREVQRDRAGIARSVEADRGRRVFGDSTGLAERPADDRPVARALAVGDRRAFGFTERVVVDQAGGSEDCGLVFADALFEHRNGDLRGAREAVAVGLLDADRVRARPSRSWC